MRINLLLVSLLLIQHLAIAQFPVNNNSRLNQSENYIDKNWLQEAQKFITEGEYDFKKTSQPSFEFYAVNNAQKIGLTFTNSGYKVSPVQFKNERAASENWEAGFEFIQISKGDNSFTATGQYTTAVTKHGLRYGFSQFDIEYINNEKGLRQNFIVSQKPGGDKNLEVVLQVQGDLLASVQNNELLLKDKNGVNRLFYKDLKVWDANHQPLNASMKLRDENTLAIVVDDKSAQYPITIDPLNQTPVWTTSADGILPGLVGQLAINAAYGFSVAGLGDVNADGYADVAIGAPAMVDLISGTGSLAAVGGVFVYYGSSSGLPILPSAKLQPTTLVAGALFGFSLAGGDITGDGKNDIIVGAPLDRVTISIGGGNTASGNVGKAYVFSGATLSTNTSPLLTLQLSGNGILRNGINLSVRALFGFSVAVTEDLNADNKKDIIIGAPTYAGIKTGLLGDVADVQSGGAFVFLTASNLNNISQVKLEPIKQSLLGLGLLSSNIDGLLFGYAVDGTGDYNGDGRPDVVATAPAGINAGSISALLNGKLLQGSAIVYYGTGSGVNVNPGAVLTATSGGLLTNLIGSIANVANLFGESVRGVRTAAGVRNGNILVGAPLGGAIINVLGLDLKTGTVSVFKKKGSSPSGYVAPDQVLSSPRNSNNVLQLIQSNLLFGYSLDNVLDVNCDGYGDIVVGEPASSGVQLLNANVAGGAAYVYLGNAGGTYQSAPVWTLTAYEDAFLGINTTSLIGYSVAGAGKVKGGTSNPTVLVGSPSRTLDFGSGLLNLGNTLGTLFSLTSGNNGVGKAFLFDLKICDHSPLAVNDIIATNEDTPVSGNVATNDTPSEDGGNTWSLAGPNGGAAHGTVTMNPDGTYTYTPAPDYNGPDAFTYQLCDTDGDCSTATVAVTVIPVDDLPVAANDVNTTNEDTPVTGNAATNDTPSADGGNTWSLVGTNGGAAHGTVTMNNDGTYTYTPAANYNGSDVFTYKLCDADGDCSTATVTITINAVDDAPTAVNDVATTNEDTPVTGSVATNDTPSGDCANTWSLVGPNGGATHGTVTMNANGTYTYTPAANYNGSDVFTYQLCDCDGDCSTATVTITVNPVDDTPAAVNDVATTNEDTPVTGNAAANDTPSGDCANTWSLVGANGGATHGTVTMNVNGTYTYTPAANYNGSDIFTYQLCDCDGDCSTATVTITVNPVDDAPTAVNDVNSTNEDTPVSGNASTNDTPSGDGGNVWSLVGANGGATHGTVTMNANGTYTYTPAVNYNGSDVFTYKLCDADGDCSTATVTITINPVDDAPTAVNDVATTNEDTPVTGNAATNDTPSGDCANTWSLVGVNGGATHGTVTMNANGTYTYTPAANYNGSDVFTYQLCDCDGDCSIATVTITVNPVDDAPTAVNDVNSTNEDTPVSGNASTNDTPSGDGGNVWSLVGTNGGATHGTVTMNTNGTYTYTPAANYNGSDVFTYKLCDADCSTATVTITINPVDDAPTAVNDVATTNEDTPISGNASTNDTPSGDGGNVWSLVGANGGATHGTVTMNPDGTYTYTPAPNYNGSDVFTYKLCDADGDCSTATVTITISPVDDAPTAVNDVNSTNEDTPVSGNASTNDTPSGDGGNVWSLVGANGGATHGTVTMNANGTYTYTPAANYNGSDVFTYKLCDADGDCSTATVTITINPVDDAPTAVNDVATTNEDTPVSGNASTNDTPSGDGGNVWSLVGANGGATHGTVTMNPDGTYTYTPAPNYNGSDVFTYKLCDADGDCSTATVTITINPVDDAPTAVNDVATTNEDTPVNGNASTNDTPSGDGGNVWSLVGANGGATHGTVTMNANGTYTYTPAANYNGSDVFTYKLCDADGDCSTATVTITINPVDDAPTAVNDVATTNEDTPISGNASTNDTPSGDGGNVWSLVGANGGATHGTVTMNPDGTYTYTPAPNYNGSDVFTYKLCDADGDCSTATVTITISPVDDAPIAVNDVVTTNEDTPVSGNASTNDTPSGDGGNVWSLVGPNGGATHGTVTMNANGTYTYTPAANYNGSDVFTYKLCDADGDCSTATVTITINPVDDAPTAVNDVATTNEDTPVTGNAATNDTPSGDCANTWSLVGANGGATHGTVTMNANGTYTYTPAANYNGSDVFTYQLCDCDGDCSTATVTITVNPVDDLPTAVNDVNSTNEDTPVSGNASTNDTPSGDGGNAWSLVGANGGAAHGTVTMNANGTYTYTPAANYNGSDVFSYKLCDADGDCSTATVTITINPVDDAPTAVNDVATTNEDTPVTGNAATNDLPSGDCANTWSLVGANGGAAHGTVTMNANGTYTYTPTPNYNGSDIFTYQLCDCDGDCSTATITITVNPVDDVPVAVNDVNSTNQNTAVNGNASTNDTPSGDGGNVWSLVGANGGAAHGTVSMNANGTYTYTPAAGYNGSDVFTYKLCDADGDCSTATVTITISSVCNMSLSATVTNATCPGVSNGAIDVTVSGANGNVTYLWNDGATTQDRTGLAAGSYSVTATDALGCTVASVTYNITATDAIPPTILCPSNKTLVLGASCSANLPDYRSLATVSDNCTAQANITIVQSPAAGTVLNGTGSTTVTLTATDASGNSTNCSFTVTRVDQTAPAIICPSSKTLVLGSTCSVTLPDYRSQATVSDNCTAAANITITQSPAPGTILNGTGSTTIILTATDASGNNANCSFTVTRVDQTAPVLTCQSAKTIGCGMTLTFDAPTATDNCGGVTINVISTTSTDIGDAIVNTRTWQAVDGAGNLSATCSQSVTQNKCSAHIFPTSTTCDSYKNGAQPLAQLCYASSAQKVSNVTPGVFFYFSYITAPSASFCIDVVQTNSCGFKMFSIQQGKQITLFNNNCTSVASGTEVSTGQGQICVSNAVPGAQYVLVVKYDSKSVQGSTFTGAAPVCQYNFESRINGVAVNNTQGSINMVPNCNSSLIVNARSEQPAEDSGLTGQLSLFPNPASDYVTLSFVPVHSGNSGIAVFDISGKLVSNIYNGNLEQGKPYQKRIDTRVLSAGVYIIQIRNRVFTETRKLIITK